MTITVDTGGTFSIAPTPFHPDGRVDDQSIDRMTDFYTEVGCDGITVLGIVGEAPKLDATEALDVATRVIRRAGGASVIVGVSAADFAAMRSLARNVMDAGAAGVMIAPVVNSDYRPKRLRRFVRMMRSRPNNPDRLVEYGSTKHDGSR